MSKAAMNLQDSFLNQVRRENTEVKVLLVNGTGLRGIVKGFDNFTVILQSRGGQHLIYKHAIAQLMHQKHGGGIRREGEEGSAGEGGAGEQEGAAASGDASASAEPQPKAERQPRGDRQQGRGDQQSRGEQQPRGDQQNRADQGQQNRAPRKEGFNKLDLSAVRLSSEEEQKVESK